MANSGPTRGTTAFAALSAALITTYFAFAVFAAWVILQYGVRTTDFGWTVQRLGDGFYVSQVVAGGPAQGNLETGDRIVTVNADKVSSEAGLGLALRSVAGSSLYTLRIVRNGMEKEVWLKSSTHAGFGFFEDRLPLLGSSVMIFFSGLALLLNWNNVAARYGFVASMFAALRMGAWAILPLASYFRPQEFHPLFVFFAPVGLSFPLAYLAVLHFSDTVKPRIWRPTLGWGMVAVWIAVLVVTGSSGSIPAPIPEGFVRVYWDHVEYQPSEPAIQIAAAALIGLALLATAAWLRKLYIQSTDEDLRRRLLWLMIAGVAFGIPAAMFELLQWLDFGAQASRWGWLTALVSFAFSYALTAENISKPSMVLRSIAGLLLPEPIFQKLDHKFFPEEANVEAGLRQLVSELEDCQQLERLATVLTGGLERTLAPAAITFSDNLPIEEMLDLGPKKNGEPYTRRERKLIYRALSVYQSNHQRSVRKKKAKIEEDVNLDLLRECPRCGACYDNTVVRCDSDGEVPTLSLPIGRTIDEKYVLERRVGRGGMGAVYSGRDIRLGRRIAVKIMLSELFGQEKALRRFEREAQLAAKLNHPNVVQIYDFGPIGAMGAYLVMEYVEGRTWREEITESGAIPSAKCLPWATQLLDGIEAAHDCGIIHRDLKPENLLLSDRGDGTAHLKILDFGLAKMQLFQLSAEEHLSLGVNTVGTIGYVPREQLTGGKVDERSDIYAIGRVLIETINGTLPEVGTGEIDEPLANVLMRCVGEDKEQRYRSIGDLRVDLLPALGHTLISQ